ncbi:MAG: phosphatidate cytidylyltransferase [Betaproteobacteria bacterium]|nr:phosphatidate cytidylyltransferase [Betaproteobacteria bacterium]
MLKARIVTAIALLGAFLSALFYLPEPFWSVLVLAIAALAALEWGGFCGFSKTQSLGFGAVTLVLGAAALWAPIGGGQQTLLFALRAAAVFWVLIVPLWIARGWRIRSRFPLALAGWIVLVPTALSLVELRGVGPQLLLALLGLIWIADSAAYFAGRAWGRRRLAPAISPGKTWEGVAGAAVSVTAYGIALGALAGIGLWIVPAFWALAALGILGDLYESLLKRQAGLKDSGSILPGHGGILDRIDSLTATLPVAALFVLHGPPPS